jgi:hypothetical protein
MLLGSWGIEMGGSCIRLIACCVFGCHCWGNMKFYCSAVFGIWNWGGGNGSTCSTGYSSLPYHTQGIPKLLLFSSTHLETKQRLLSCSRWRSFCRWRERTRNGAFAVPLQTWILQTLESVGSEYRHKTPLHHEDNYPMAALSWTCW